MLSILNSGVVGSSLLTYLVQSTNVPDPKCSFTNIHKQLPGRFALYAEFESILKLVCGVDTAQGVKNTLRAVLHIWK